MSMTNIAHGGARAPRNSALLPGSLRVVELGESVSTAICGRLLFKLGAQVTQVAVAGEARVLDESGPFVGEDAQRVSTLGLWLRDGKTRVDVDLDDATAHGN